MTSFSFCSFLPVLAVLDALSQRGSLVERRVSTAAGTGGQDAILKEHRQNKGFESKRGCVRAWACAFGNSRWKGSRSSSGQLRPRGWLAPWWSSCPMSLSSQNPLLRSCCPLDRPSWSRKSLDEKDRGRQNKATCASRPPSFLLTRSNLTLFGGSAVLRVLVGRHAALYLKNKQTKKQQRDGGQRVGSLIRTPFWEEQAETEN